MPLSSHISIIHPEIWNLKSHVLWRRDLWSSVVFLAFLSDYSRNNYELYFPWLVGIMTMAVSFVALLHCVVCFNTLHCVLRPSLCSLDLAIWYTTRKHDTNTTRKVRVWFSIFGTRIRKYTNTKIHVEFSVGFGFLFYIHESTRMYTIYIYF